MTFIGNSSEKSNKMQQCIKIYYSIPIWSSTCFGWHTAHHKELKTVLAASGFAYVEGCWTCGCWTIQDTIFLFSWFILSVEVRGTWYEMNQFNPFQSKFSTNCILPSSCLFWAGKRLVDYLWLSYSLKEKNIAKQKECNLCYLLAKVRSTWGKASDRLRQRANKRNKNHVGRGST
jgi:hypothetical protein